MNYPSERRGTAVRPLSRWERRGGLYTPSKQRTILLVFDTAETALAWDQLSDEQVGALLAEMTAKALNDDDD